MPHSARCGVLLALLATSCGQPPESTSFTRLERLVFQPEGTCVLFAATNAPIDCSGDRPLLIDRFEVTRGEWSRWMAGRDAEAEGNPAAEYWADLSPQEPATGMTLDEAEAFASDQGMRLPTAREWLRAAVGGRAQVWPWGPFPARSAANTLDLGLNRLAPVGSFESGSTPAGVHDLLGNAEEWVTDRIELDGEGLVADRRVWAMGGSFRRYKRESYSPGADGAPQFNAELVDRQHRGDDLGLRLVADAETWLREASRGWDDDPESLAQLRVIGASWGRSAAPLLRRLAGEPDSALGLRALLEGAQR